MPDPTPDARRLAALLDGRLSPAERERLLGELAASDDALEVYADAAAALAAAERDGVAEPAGAEVVSLEEERGRRPPPAPAPAPRWRVPRWAVAAAATAVLAVGPALWWRARPAADAEGGVPSYAELLAPATPAEGLPAGWDGTPWRATRGAGDPLTDDARAVRTGARVTDLELAAAAGDTAAARVAAGAAAALLDEVPGAGAAAAVYRALGAGPLAPDPAVLARARRDAALVAGADAFALGAWLEAARVAAARRDAAFFRTAESRAALGRLRAAAGGRPDVVAATELLHTALAPAIPAWDSLPSALIAALRALSR